ncbi:MULTISPECIES: MBL fold metallo-hydrolase [Vibrio]|uniref:MBL fold metallo-hydrolase n=1 Tax=Vibrio casei TaxID=673372 RepID=A0A368LJE0_9VIBR|nr:MULTISPECIES: MBL fold metallo-hydrolase [Vibrio]RCS70791.1 MBL fold metallo-hydrolase [Vibrio casei]SJN25030.1 Metallo-beta-lactamase superfamily protein PA0057 [Vibrio casei]HBV76847.1 MBL fold metallo-hydrolase [Vibrio sp.]
MKTFTLLTTSLIAVTSAHAAMQNETQQMPLTLQVYHAAPSSFDVNSTLVYGQTEAAVIDAGFSKADALRIAANVLDSGKKLTTIFISQADPDYYFGIETLKQYFPDAKVLATPAVRDEIKHKMASKIEYWVPKMGVNAPVKPVVPDAYTLSSFSVDGQKIEIRGSEGVLAHRPYLWIPSLKAIVGNVGIYGDMQVWTADTQTQGELNAWVEQLAEMKALKPQVVVPGHMEASTSLDISTIQSTEDYLNAFIKAKKSSKNSQELIDKMMAIYPEKQVPLTLSLGAKVHMGEMKW